MAFKKPIIIIGAPRSGTSLMQQIIRGETGFLSVAKESQIIWEQYTHPKYNDWIAEGALTDRLGDHELAHVREAFAQYALSARVWRLWERLGIMRYRSHPMVGTLLEIGYRTAYPALSLLKRYARSSANTSTRGRLVDKSVHAGLWLNFVDRVFPDARYIYVKRSGREAVASMIRGWLDPERFFTYEMPVPLRIRGYPHALWNFSLPTGWHDYVDAPLERVVAFQWQAVHESIHAHFDGEWDTARVLPVKLEDLVSSPESELRRICAFSGLPWSRHFQALSRRLPIVNAGAAGGRDDDAARMTECVMPEIASMQRRLGY